MRKLITPDRAEQQDCCGPQAAHNQHSGVCTGPNCMAWLWWDDPKESEQQDWMERRGYCGLVKE